MKLRRCSIRNSTFISFSSLITASLFSVSTQATAPPVGYDDWSVASTGYISSTCPAGYSCGFEVNNPGFQQQRLVGNGDFFFRTIIDEGDYSSVSLIRAYNIRTHQSPVERNGLVNKQNINKKC